jgi:hypothetical protein
MKIKKKNHQAVIVAARQCTWLPQHFMTDVAGHLLNNALDESLKKNLDTNFIRHKIKVGLLDNPI